VPFVLIDRSIPGVECDVVLGDSVAGARRLVEHLIALGHRRIGMIVEDENVSTARDRRAGYVEALEDAGIPFDPALVVRALADPQGGVVGMEKLLRLDERPTAVFTVNNLVALGAIEAVRAAGLEVPDDVAFVCFDDIEYASLLYPFLRLYPFHPFLTVMLQPAETFGTLGTQLLFERIEGGRLARARKVVLPGDFVVRESCGAKAAGAV
jgi:LacI family transcriptional regulator